MSVVHCNRCSQGALRLRTYKVAEAIDLVKLAFDSRPVFWHQSPEKPDGIGAHSTLVEIEANLGRLRFLQLGSILAPIRRAKSIRSSEVSLKGGAFCGALSRTAA